MLRGVRPSERFWLNLPVVQGQINTYGGSEFVRVRATVMAVVDLSTRVYTERVARGVHGRRPITITIIGVSTSITIEIAKPSIHLISGGNKHNTRGVTGGNTLQACLLRFRKFVSKGRASTLQVIPLRVTGRPAESQICLSICHMTNDPLMPSPCNGVAKRKFGLLRVVWILVIFGRSTSFVISNVKFSDQFHRCIFAVADVKRVIGSVYIHKAAFQESLYLRIK